MEKINKTEEEWKNELPPEVYKIARERGTEPPFSGKYVDAKDEGIYRCAACGAELFSSDTKFNSGTGWPSFWNPAFKENIEFAEDSSLGYPRAEVRCARCGAHLGHVFDDGPLPTGKRYCINSSVLNLDKK